MNRPMSWLRAAAAAMLLALGGCTVKTTVQATATTPANVTHLYVTVKEIHFHADADALPDDAGWTDKVLADPVTIDLVDLNGGGLATLGSITLTAVDYSQLRLVLVDTYDTLADSADDLGLAYNNVVQYVDSAGISTLVPLELAGPGGSLLVPVSIRLDATTTSSGLSAALSGSSSEDSAAVTVDIDALRGLIIFDYGGVAGAMLSPGLAAYDDAQVGTITGTFDLSAIASAAIDSDQGIVASAAVIDADGTRHTFVKSTRVDSDGSFTLYPLPVDGSTDTGTYDVVVHGPGVATLVVTGVSVEAGETTTLQDSDITLPSSASFVVNTTSAVPGGTVAGFYQTLPSGTLPYLIDSTQVNPFGTGFGADFLLAGAALVYGAYNDGDLISFASGNAQEGAAAYQLTGDSRWRAPGGFTTFAGATGGSEDVQLLDLPWPGLPADAVAATISGTIRFSATGQYDSLYLIVSRGGQLVDAIDLSAAAAGSAGMDFTVEQVPGGTLNAVYDLTVRAWNSGDPAGTLVRVAFATKADLRLGDASGLTLQL